MTSEIKYRTKEEALAAVIQHGTELQFCSPELQNDEEVVIVAIRQNELAVDYASDELKSNKVFIMKALNEGVPPFGLISYSTKSIQSDIEVMTLAIEKDIQGFVFVCVKGEAAHNKTLTAKALVKWGNLNGYENFSLWGKLPPTLKEFFPKDCFYKKAQSYLCQLEQEKQAEMVSGGSKEEDGVVW